MIKKILVSFLIFLSLFLFSSKVWAVRIKDIANIKGARENQLVGYGLVVGLNGTGDKDDTKFTIQSVVNMLQKMGISLDPKEVKVKNVAAVMVTTNLPPFARSGNRIDALVSSLGSATSLQGGTLLLTPLKGVDGEVYGVAQGPISVGGFAVGGAAGGGVQKNHPTVGRVGGGVLIEREIPLEFNSKNSITISLNQTDFTTAFRLTQAVNQTLGEGRAKSVDAGTIEVEVPAQFKGKIVELVALLEKLEIAPDTVAKVILNERTGTVVIGEQVKISTVAVSHGNLSLEVKEQSRVSQPLPFSPGETVVIPESRVTVEEEKGKLVLVPGGVSINEVVKALNAIGASPRDLIAILQAIKAAGALPAVLEII